MKKFITLLLATMLLVSGCATNDKLHSSKQLKIVKKNNPPEDFIPRNIRIVAAGDSLTQGVGDSTKNGGYIPYLEKSLESLKGINQVRFSNYGIKGNRSDQLLSRLKHTELKTAIKKSDMVIITIGGNDVMKVFRENFANLKLNNFEEALVEYKKRLDSILQTIRTINPNVGIVLIGIYNPFMKWFSDIKEVDEIIASWNKGSEQIVNQYEKTKFVTVFDIFENQQENLLYTDYFHPNDQGYKLISDRIFTNLNEKELFKLIE